ncbi:hypothetical protein FRC19_003202 [Serendipita sp. 401]|nr:hypothetical protein FRC19_003202 [Serendipita sp. 401]KAG8825065.1 hypothetical protein FRC18_010395 [Serendipita sp. 400]
MAKANGTCSEGRDIDPTISLQNFRKVTTEDSSFVTYSNDRRNTPIPVFVLKDTTILVNVAAIHYNPKYWKDPRPE